jgi:hypothetical protein
MFVVGAAEAAASGLPPLASEVKKGIVKLAAEWKDLTDDYVMALSKSFGNWDRVVGLGWLIADSVRPVGLPILPRADGHAIGLRAGRAVGKIKAEVRSAKLVIQRAACKPGANRESLEQRVAEAEARVLCETIEVGVPPTTRISTAPVSQPTGSRKRARVRWRWSRRMRKSSSR